MSLNNSRRRVFGSVAAETGCCKCFRCACFDNVDIPNQANMKLCPSYVAYA